MPYLTWEWALLFYSGNEINWKIKSTPKLERNPLISSLCKVPSLLSSGEVLMCEWAQEKFDFIPKMQFFLQKSFFSRMRFCQKLCDFTFCKTLFQNSPQFENIRGKIEAKAEKKKSFFFLKAMAPSFSVIYSTANANPAIKGDWNANKTRIMNQKSVEILNFRDNTGDFAACASELLIPALCHQNSPAPGSSCAPPHALVFITYLRW